MSWKGVREVLKVNCDANKLVSQLYEVASKVIGAVVYPTGTYKLVKNKIDIDLRGQNIEREKQLNILDKTVNILENTSPLSAKPKKINEDFVAMFFDKCKYFSDEYVQNLWAKLLADEVKEPGKFSCKTLNILSTLGPKEAKAFHRLCGFTCDLKVEFMDREEQYSWVLIHDPNKEIVSLCLHFIQNSLGYINTLMFQEILKKPCMFELMTPEDHRAICPLINSHITPYGSFQLNMRKRLKLGGYNV